MAERERVREREREAERRKHDYDWNEARAVRWEIEKRLFEEAPRVVRYDSVPWEQVHQAYHKVLTGDNLPDLDRKLRRAPIFTMSARLQILESGTRSGNHRHYHEALFFILSGKGHEVHDETRYDWGVGDLVIVPAYCIHQHFCDEGPANIFYVVGDLAPQVGLGTIEQMELNPNFSLPDGAKLLQDAAGTVIGYQRRDGKKILFQEYAIGRDAMARRWSADTVAAAEQDDHYERYLRLFNQETRWRRDVPHVIHQSQRRWEDTRNGRIMWLTHPDMDTGIRTYECYLQELAPGASSGKHRHVGEEVRFIIEGSGYDVIDGKRWDWDANDLVAAPVCSVHQSFNRDPDKPARFLVVKSMLYDFMGFAGIEHLEDARG
jgi:gentisate 1,2-dioxygenase